MDRMMDISLPESEPLHERLEERRRFAPRARQHQGRTRIIGVLLLAILAGAVAGVIFAKLQTGPAETNFESTTDKEREASEKLALAEAAKRQLQRDSLLERLERLRVTPHITSWNTGKCWSDQAWDLVSQAAAFGIDDNLRSQAASTLAGLDARLAKPFREMAASSVVFDPRGKLLLIGGAPAHNQYPAEAAKVWDSEGKVVLHTSNLQDAGPVAFGPNGAPLQLAAQEGPSLVLWNVAKQIAVSKFEFNAEPRTVVRLAHNAQRFPLLAMTADGSFVAAVGITVDDKAVIAVWENSSGKRLFQMPAQATALAFSPEGKYLATGDNLGKVTVWPVVQEGNLEYVHAGRLPIQSLAFSPDSSALAVADAGGGINIWKRGGKLPPTACSGPFDTAFALAFSPDGALFASGGRGPAKLWDARTGRLLLQIGCEDFITGLAFTTDGRSLAVSSRSEISPGEVSIWSLDYSRGIQILHGLAAPATQTCFSPDGRLLAALGHDGQVAIWNRETGQLVRTLDAPQGKIIGMAFSPHAKKFALSAGTQAKSFDTATGKELGAWELPDGSLDLLAFHPTGKLLLFRMEIKDDSPVCLVRSLVEPKTVDTVAEIKELEISEAKAPLDGRYIVVEAKSGQQPRRIEAFDPITGSKLWPPSESGNVEGNQPQVDPTGKIFAFRADKKTKLVEMPAGQLREAPATDLAALGQEGQLWVKPSREQASMRQSGYLLFRDGSSSSLVTLGIDSSAASPCIQFNLAGSHLAWANADGSVSVCDLERIRKKLAEVGLGW
jgi:WD40 repeat protein